MSINLRVFSGYKDELVVKNKIGWCDKSVSHHPFSYFTVTMLPYK
jgi:hypothetical protein